MGHPLLYILSVGEDAELSSAKGRDLPLHAVQARHGARRVHRGLPPQRHVQGGVGSINNYDPIYWDPILLSNPIGSRHSRVHYCTATRPHVLPLQDRAPHRADGLPVPGQGGACLQLRSHDREVSQSSGLSSGHL